MTLSEGKTFIILRTRNANLAVIYFDLSVHFLDKEAGVMVDKFFGTKTQSECRESEGLQKNGIQELAENNDQAMSKDLLSMKESTADYLSRKLFEVN